MLGNMAIWPSNAYRIDAPKLAMSCSRIACQQRSVATFSPEQVATFPEIRSKSLINLDMAGNRLLLAGSGIEVDIVVGTVPQ